MLLRMFKEKQNFGGSTFCGERMRKKKILTNYGIMNSVCRNYVHKNYFFLGTIHIKCSKYQTRKQVSNTVLINTIFIFLY